MRTVRQLIEDITQSIDQPWCFLENEAPDGQHRDVNPRRVLRPDSRRSRRRG